MTTYDFSDVRGAAATAIAPVLDAIAARAGILLVGPPGVGKTMIARRIPSAMPALTEHESAWLTAEYDAMGLRPGVVTERPFRAPHHTVSAAALIGGSVRLHRPACHRSGPSRQCDCPRDVVTRAGEADLARFGVLFLDDVAEFSRTALESLARRIAAMGATAPLLVGSAMGCPCGWAGSTARACVCSKSARDSYGARVERMAAMIGRTALVTVPLVTLADLRAAQAQDGGAL